MTSGLWRLWTRLARWRETRYGDPKTDGWTTAAIERSIAAADDHDPDAPPGRHRQRRQP